MDDINITKMIFRDDDEGPNEALIEILIQEIRKGVLLRAPVVMEYADGTYRIVEGRNRIEAAKREGAVSCSAYVVEEMSDEKFMEMRRGLNDLDRASN